MIATPRACRWIVFAALAFAAPPAFAQSGAEVAPSAPASGAVTAPSPAVVEDIATEAADAVRAVKAFSAAIQAGRLDEAAALLDPGVLVLESGGAERSREHYLAEHAAADSAFMQAATQTLHHRQARAVGDVAWVGTESELAHEKDGKTRRVLSTETMVLRRTAAGWKIVHIHWSSRSAPVGK